MTNLPKHLVENAIKHKHNDFCPYYFFKIRDTELNDQLCQYYQIDDFHQSIIKNYVEFCGQIKAQLQPLPDGTYRDEFGSVLKLGSIPHLLKPALQAPSLANYKFPDLATDIHFEKVPRKVSQYSDRFRIIQLQEIFFERAWNMRGMQEFMMDIILEPKFVEELLDQLMNIMLRCVDKIISTYLDSIESIGWTDDYGGQNGLLINPTSWRKLFKPRLATLCDKIHKAGKYIYFHSCGNIEAIMPDLIEIGVDIVNPIQPETMDIFKLKREYGRDVCFFGGVGAQHTIMTGTPDQVTAEVEKCITVVGKSGGLIVAPTKPITEIVPFENALALVRALTEQDF